jgi:mono/diheme cytochrome c family protein
MRIVISIFVLAGIGVGCGDAAQTPTKASINAADLYMTRCAGCHGSDGNLQLSGAKALSASQMKKEEITAQIKMGKGSMPPFEGRLSDKEIQALADYVISFRAK